MLKSFFIRAAVAAATVAASLVTAAPADAATVLAVATWNAEWKAGGSDCDPVTSVVIACEHHYNSIMTDPVVGRTVETCTAAGAAILAEDLEISTCSAQLDGMTSGPGKFVTDDYAICETIGLDSMTFNIQTLVGPYTIVIPLVENNEVITRIHATQATSTGLVQTLNATYTAGCGTRTSGEFRGSWTLTKPL